MMDLERERELWFLKLLLPGFGAPSRSTKALQSSSLSKLPPEIIQHIGNYIPIASAAAFSVTCHTLNLILGNHYLQAMEKKITTYHPGDLIIGKHYLPTLKALERGDLVFERCKSLLLLAHELPLHAAKYIGNMDCINAPEPEPPNEDDYRGFWDRL
ncbi:hypothetical protein N431DRAFT_431920 [Stipitochalara longipes BDJ]|nr:hypothetical protein N431DRAFT_431920 [Stipitochalara longipes BDJ]